MTSCRQPPAPVSAQARSEVERVARASYSRLFAFLAARCRDFAAAEDALGDALVAALRTWPRDGVPAKPEAWLLTAARNALTDRARHQKVVVAGEATLALLHQAACQPARSEDFPDSRLKLLFVCTHPAIDPALRAPLMLQTVLGLDAAALAPAFLLSPAAMSQRLVRAKARIRAAGLRFEVPEPEELPRRLDAVLEAVYGAFGLGSDGVATDVPSPSLQEEALWIARDLLHLLPHEPEIAGLLALMLHSHARRAARRSATGAYVPLSEQDTGLWDQPMIAEAETLLMRASAFRRPGRFQLEAVIQSVHAERARTGRTDWSAIVYFYEALVRLVPTLGVRTAQAAAVAEAGDADAGLALLDAIDPKSVASYQPYWAVRADLLGRLDRRNEARTAYDLAMAVSRDPAVREYLLSKCRALKRHPLQGAL